MRLTKLQAITFGLTLFIVGASVGSKATSWYWETRLTATVERIKASR